MGYEEYRYVLFSEFAQDAVHNLNFGLRQCGSSFVQYKDTRILEGGFDDIQELTKPEGKIHHVLEHTSLQAVVRECTPCQGIQLPSAKDPWKDLSLMLSAEEQVLSYSQMLRK
jgi:hypothetical protein